MERLEICLSRAGSQSIVLFIEESVYCLTLNSNTAVVIADHAKRLSFYALGLDLEARGICGKDIGAYVEVIDYDGFVDLTINNELIKNWD